MSSLRTAALVACAIAGTARAAPKDKPHRVLVLPVDGTADPVLRASVGQSVKRLAHSLDGAVSDGDTTFAEAAAAVGCDPSAPACANEVLQTLAVDEIVYATATTANGTTQVVVRRIAKDAPPREAVAQLAAQDPPEHVEPPLAPLFPGAVIAPQPPSPSTPVVTPPVATRETASADEHGDRNTAIVCITGGGLFVVLGMMLWVSESGLQSDIDHHPTSSQADFADLTQLEDRASSRAIWGNVTFAAGLIAAGVGGYFLWRSQTTGIAVSPQPLDHGAGVSLGGHW